MASFYIEVTVPMHQCQNDDKYTSNQITMCFTTAVNPRQINTISLRTDIEYMLST